MTITATNESTVSKPIRWSIGLAREVEWVRFNREDNLIVCRFPITDNEEFGREVSDIVPAFRQGTVVAGRRKSDDQLVQGIVTSREYHGIAVWTAEGVDFYYWSEGAATRWTETVSPAIQEMVSAFWRHFQDTATDLREQKGAVIREYEAWKARVVTRAHQEANDRDWCDDFDDIMEEFGLPRRSYEYEVEVDVPTTVRVTVRASGTDADDAMDNVTNEQVREAFRHSDKFGEQSDGDDWTPVDARKVS